MNHRLAFLVVLLALCGSCTHKTVPPVAAQAALTDRPLSVENFDGELMSALIVEDTDRVRLANGAAAVTRNAALDGAADEQAASMALAGEAEHGNPFPGEHNVAERVATQGVPSGHVGENVIMLPILRGPDGVILPCTYAEFAARIVGAWMNSPSHRENMLEPHFTQIGCGCRLAHGGIAANFRVYACQVFYLTHRDQGVVPGTWPP